MFYKNFIKLCNLSGESPSSVAEKVGISKSNVTRWGKDKGGASDATLQKLADYFGITLDELKGETDIKEKPTAESSSELSELDKKLHNAITQIQDEEKKRWLLKMIQSLSEEE